MTAKTLEERIYSAFKICFTFVFAMFWLQFCFYFLIFQQIQSIIEIGSLLQSSQDRRLLQSLWFYHNLSSYSTKHDITKDQYRLIPINYQTSADIPDKVCHAIEAAARRGNTFAAILGSAEQPADLVGESYSRELEISYLSMVSESNARLQLYRLRTDKFLPQKSIDLWPEKVAIGEVISDLIEKYKTPNVLVIYNTANDLSSLQSYLKNSYRPNGERKTQFRIFASNGDNKPLIKNAIQNFQPTTFILHSKISQAINFIIQANELGACKIENTFILTASDAFIEPLENFKSWKCNITVISFIDPDSSKVQALRHFLRYNGFNDKLPPINNNGIQSKIAIWSDTVAVLKKALLKAEILKHGISEAQENPICQRIPLTIKDFRTTLVTTKISNGLTGNISFESDGRRKEFEMFVFQSDQRREWNKVNRWNSKDRKLLPFKEEKVKNDTTDKRLHLKVTVYLEEPFVSKKPNTSEIDKNDQYEGYCIDLLEKIAELRNFTYEIYEVPDKTYGVKEANGRWTGMVGELQSGVADLAVASLTVTYTRSEVLDFTVPYMHLGISILFKRPKASMPGFFTFMAPLGFDVWIWTLSAYIGTSLSIWVLAMLSPIEQKKSSANKLTLINSFWFTVSSLMQQGPEISPKAPSTRIATAFWWFFAIIFISSYTANLAAFLTTERMITPIENADDLAKQTKIKYGTLGRGSTMTFFNESKIETYSKMWKQMEAQPSLFVKSSKEGIQRVKTSEYAYLMESSMLEYAIERDCELIQVGGLLDQKGYAIGLPKGSPHRELISTAILSLQEKTVLTELKDKWWKQKRGGGVCQHTKVSRSEYGAYSVGGIFIILIAGLVISISIAALELILEAKNIAKAKSSYIRIELIKMIKKSWNEQRRKDDRLKRKIDDIIEFKSGIPIRQYENPSATEEASPSSS